jgi:hypothetical protein
VIPWPRRYPNGGARRICSCLKREGGVGSYAGEPPMFLCRLNEILRSLQTLIPRINRAGPVHARARCGMKENVGINYAWRVRKINFSSFDIEMVQPRFVGVEKQSARAQIAVRAHNAHVTARVAYAHVAARVAIQTSKSHNLECIVPWHRLILRPMSKPGGALPARYTHC